MTREMSQGKRVAILATGDEIISGDILNTNANMIARLLTDNNMVAGTQMVTADHIHEIEQAIRWLLQEHDSLIITGGLGPTSDDLTRFALAKAIDRPLLFHDPVWEKILTRLKHFGYAKPPESNRQQALFPDGAEIIQNDAGTAAGCIVHIDQKSVFMLPGPPPECLPMVHNTVLPTLRKAHFSQKRFGQRWLLFGASEGQIAETLDNIAFDGHCQTGYRLCYPYVEFKLFADNHETLEKTATAITEKIATYLINNGSQTASDWFYEQCIQSQKKLSFCDQATGGTLENTLRTPKTAHLFSFGVAADQADVIITGLDTYWQAAEDTHARIALQLPCSANSPDISDHIPFRGAKVRYYATEWICRALGRVFFL